MVSQHTLLLTSPRQYVCFQASPNKISIVLFFVAIPIKKMANIIVILITFITIIEN